MSEDNNKKVSNVKIAVGYLSHMLINLIMFAGVAYFINEIILEEEWNENYYLYAAALFVIMALYSLLDCRRLYSYFRTEIIMILCFMVSALLLLLSDYYINVPLWLLGGIAAAALINRNIGMLYVYFFVFHAIYLQGECLNGLIFHLVCATIICMVIPKMKTWMSMLYMMVFTGALVIAMTIFMNRFIVDKLILLDTFSIMCTYFACIFFTMFFVSLVKPKLNPEESLNLESVPEEEPVNYDYLELVAQETVDVLPVQGEENVSYAAVATETAVAVEPEADFTGITVREDFSDYCNEKAEVMQELKKQRKTSYAHAILAAKLAYQAAESVELNATLAKAAALYEAVAELYQETELRDALTEQNVPETLVHTVVSLKEGSINTKEIAVVAMADDIISNYTVIRHIRKMSLAPEKIVDKTLDKKIFGGEYNQSGLKVSEYSGLRNSFVAFLKEQDERISK